MDSKPIKTLFFNKTDILSILLVLFIGFVLFSGCAKKEDDDEDDTSTASSTAGLTWVQTTDNTGVFYRENPAVAVFDNKMWVVGGKDSNDTPMTDVWSSPDGINWTQVTASASFPTRFYHSIVAFQDKLWLIGGRADTVNSSGSNQLGDIWYTLDGSNWILANSSGEFGFRDCIDLFVFQDKMWAIAGRSPTGLMNDVWNSADGIRWTQVTASAGFSGRNGNPVIFDNKIWIIGSFCSDDESCNDIWNSTDGVIMIFTESFCVCCCLTSRK